MRFSNRILPLFILFLLAASALQAQPNVDSFGKSRIQYKSFNWKLYSTQNFNVYFYQNGQEGAVNAAAYAERELKRITSLIGYYPYSKITLILYNSPTDLLQSNIGLNNDQYQTGGETLFMKSKIELAYGGTQTEFKHDLNYQLTELLMNDMMYGGSLKEALQSSYLLRLPEWFISGVSAYTAEGWSIEMDSYMRDMLMKQDKPRPEKVFLKSPKLTGQSVWNYIAERYGYTAIQNILNLTRITRDVEIGITSSLNIPYKRFLQDWYNYYVQINTSSESPLVQLPDGAKLFKKNKEGHFYGKPTLSPDGALLAYVKNDNGIYKIFVRDVRTGKDRVVWRAGYKNLDQDVDFDMPVLAWRSNSQLGIIEARRGKMLLRQLDARSSYKFIPFYENLTTPAATLEQFVHVNSMAYSEDGQSLVISAVRNGQTDLFVLSANGRLQKQLTNDIFDDVDPVYLRNNGGIAFSSNRWNDSTASAIKPDFNSIVNNYDIFLLQQEGPDNSIQQLTSSIASEMMPRPTQDGNLVYLSEESGIRSIYNYDLATGTSTLATNFVESIKQYDYVPSANVLALVASDEGNSFVYLLPSYTPSTLSKLPQTSRQIILETRARTSQEAAAAANKRRLMEQEKKTRSGIREEGEINIEDYEFNEDQRQAMQQKRNTAPVRRASSGGSNVDLVGPLNYDLRFSVQEIITSVNADPLLGFGIVAGVEMSDLFENHRIRGTAFMRTDFETNNFFAEYMNLSNRVDLGVQFARSTLRGSLLNAPGSIVNFTKNELTPVLKYPFSHSTSLHLKPKFVSTRFTYKNDFSIPDTVEMFWGGNAELVYDNSVVTGVNQREGTRFKVGLLSLKGFESSRGNFSKFYADFRHYLKIHRQIVLATHLSYGRFFGNSTKKFLIGGMNNWLLADEDEEAELNDVQVNSPADLFYLEYITPLRGFNFNVRSGSNHLLANAELRIPIVQYLYNGPIASGFFRNLQLTAFADAGSAYSGANPFSGNNSINTRITGGTTDPLSVDKFDITVINYRNPFLVGYGFGARTTLLGVYGKLDVAWGEEEDNRVGPKFYVTLGYDF
ncbi:PD40 domain-containing protein [Pontibacter korlensis]|uniref:WD-40-like repeat-containing protein n=1 Tax=Pontibacter korlensis TaxID=400092 RepID=A0A0E3ZDI4_9BACT|nr:PD40 domain-containing protein [Pontibacter korlensis]AKD02435.1 WD-40-like repeat-containing protein [Pontibacter korlensis]